MHNLNSTQLRALAKAMDRLQPLEDVTSATIRVEVRGKVPVAVVVQRQSYGWPAHRLVVSPD